MRRTPKPMIVGLKGRGWCVVSDCIAVVRLHDQPGFAVGVQGRFRSRGTGRVWPGLKKARRRAAELALINNLPIVESI